MMKKFNKYRNSIKIRRLNLNMLNLNQLYHKKVNNSSHLLNLLQVTKFPKDKNRQIKDNKQVNYLLIINHVIQVKKNKRLIIII